MTTHPLLITTSAIAMLATACGRDSDTADTPASTYEAAATSTSGEWQFVELAPDHPVMVTGQQAAGHLISTLLARVTAEMQSAGPIGAIDVCQREAMALTESVTTEQQNVRAIKRTSLQVRNPKNRPDPAEQLALDHFRELLVTADAAPKPFVQVGLKQGETEHRFYQPMFVAGACLLCHGSADTIQPEVAAAIRESYPEDQATGYNEGDWRGLIRISIVDAD